MWQEYLLPASVEEALEMLAAYEGEARIIAGGTDLIIQLRNKERSARCLVDITWIEELKRISMDGDTIVIGAGVAHSQVASSDMIRKRAAVLAEAAQAIGSPQIRNAGTVVGNVVNAQPAADTAVALLALGAEAEIASQAGIRRVPLEELFLGPGLSSVDSTAEVVTAVRFPALGENQGSAFERIAKRKALALPILNAAVVVTLNSTGDAFQEARIALAPVAPTPFRARGAEGALRDAAVAPASIEQALGAALQESHPRTSLLRASREYRQEMIKVLLRRAINRAVSAAKQGG